MLPDPGKWRTMPAEPVLRPWRRFLRFSVRGLIVVVLVIGMGLGWIVRSARIQRDAVAELSEVKSMSRTIGSGTTRKIDDSRPPGPGWLVAALGVDFFGHVLTQALTFGGKPQLD